MLRFFRLRKVRKLYLENSRNLKEGRTYVEATRGLLQRCLEFLTPIPVLGLHQDGALLLDALQWMEEHAKTADLSEAVVRDYHRMLFPKADPRGGVYRKGEVVIQGSRIKRPPAAKVPLLMKQFEQKLSREPAESGGSEKETRARVLNVAAAVHQKIAFIHPFQDANGRLARLAMNHVLRKHGLGYAILPPLGENTPGSKDHFETLEKAHQGDLDSFSEFIGKHLHRV